MRVLLVKTSSMGDVLHTLPALTDAKTQHPDITFDWVVEENFSQIPTWHHAVDNVIPVAIRRWRKNWFSPEVKAERKAFKEKLRQTHYDAIIDAQGLIKSAFFITLFADGQKHGYDYKSIREPLASFFYNHRYYISKKQHAVERIRRLFSLVLKYPLPTQKGDYAIAHHFLNLSPKYETSNYCVFLHSTTKDEKHWPEAHWRNLIVKVSSTGLKIKLPWGNEQEQKRAIRLAEGVKSVEVLPRLTLSEVAHELAHAKVIVSVDTGLSHLAAALDRPNVTLFGPTDPGLIGGYGKTQNTIKSDDNIMASILPEQVFNTLQSFI